MTITSQQVDAWDAEVDAAYAAGRQEGMKQERALWELSRLGQEIEAQPWRGLTKKEIDSALSKYKSWYEFAAHLENILKEKNQ